MLIALTAEKNTSGNMDIDAVKLGDATLTEIAQQASGGNNNIVWLGYLDEAAIAGRTGDTITATYTVAPTNPNDEPKILYATYQFVDQTTPIASFSVAGSLLPGRAPARVNVTASRY